jgi:hypothetical protein
MSNRSVYEQIGAEGGTESLALVADLMEQSQRQTAGLLDSLYEGERAAHERTKERLRIAEACLAQAQDRLAALFDYEPNYWSEP